MSRVARITIVTLSVIVFVYAGLGYVLGETNQDDNAYRSLTVYEEVLQHIQEDYVDQPNLNLVTSGALRGLLESLDPLSAYLSPREYADYLQRQKNARRAEVGITVSKRFGYIIIVATVPGGPGDTAGLRSGQILESIAGFGTRNMSAAQADMLLQGAPGTSVKVEVVRRGITAPKKVTLTRAIIAPQPIVASQATPDVAYIRLPTLEADDVAELHDKLVQFSNQGIRKLILDLRDCARGPVSNGIQAAEFFLPSGTITTLQGQTVPRQVFTAKPDQVVWRAPVKVLTSPSTSGAAEILAGAIGGDKRGDVIGERTFGTASEQKLIPLNDGGALLLTVAFYSTPDGKSIVKDGVVPTVEVEPTLPNASTLLNDEDNPPPLRPGQLPKADDPVYNKALELFQGGEARKAA